MTDQVIYRTTFKKGNLLQELHFSHNSNFFEAVEKVKTYLNANHLRHIHTVPFLIDLDSMHSLNGSAEGIDVG
jgi:hypothetical protein